jgi:hypothetical protein
VPRALAAVAVGALSVGLLYAAFAARIVRYDARPGAPVGQSLGVLAAILMLAALAYLPAKRSDVLSAPNRRLVLAHIGLGAVGAAVAVAHSRLVVTHPPILVLLAFLGLYGTGSYGRVIASRRMGPAFGRAALPFRPGSGVPERVRIVLTRKRSLLARLEPGAQEGTFALALSHWARHPWQATRYYALSLEERRRMRAVPAAAYSSEMGAFERWWRVGHLALAWLAVVGLLAHVVTTLFFAEWAAGDREVYWWFLRK